LISQGQAVTPWALEAQTLIDYLVPAQKQLASHLNYAANLSHFPSSFLVSFVHIL